MNLLAIETSSAIGSVALASDAAIEQREIASPREQTERLIPAIDELLRARDIGFERLDGIVFGRGPGSFTGLRVAASVAQGLATATGLPIVAVSSLRGIAQGIQRSTGASRVLVCLDARMGEVYWASYEFRDGVMRPVSDERVGEPLEVEPPPGAAPWVLAGSGCEAYPEALAALIGAAEQVLPQAVPAARDLLPLALIEIETGRTLAPAAALPVYLRDASAWREQA